MGYTLSPNMSLRIPGVGSEAGPDYAIDINYDLLSILDAHDHSPGRGAPITVSSFSINADLPFNGFFATLVAGVELSAQGSTPVPGTVYRSGVDLYYVDGLGNNVRMTQSGGVAGAPGTITNLAPPASVDYIAGSQTFVFQSNVAVAANLDAGSVILRNITPNSTNGVSLEAPAALASNYSVVMPLLPSVSSFMQIDNAGAITAAIAITGGLTTTNLSPTAGILGTQIAANTISASNLDSSVGTVPAGVITAYGGTSAPSGYLMCDGASVLRTSYSALFAAIGTAYGTVDGTHFNVPDLRGRFARGTDNGAGNDPDSASRTAINAGGNTGDNVGSLQSDHYQDHVHDLGRFRDNLSAPQGLTNQGNAPDTGGLIIAIAGNAPLTVTTGVGAGSTGSVDAPAAGSVGLSFLGTGGGVTGNVSSETAPKNVYVNYIIKT